MSSFAREQGDDLEWHTLTLCVPVNHPGTLAARYSKSMANPRLHLDCFSQEAPMQLVES